jgi:hypothetical protein
MTYYGDVDYINHLQANGDADAERIISGLKKFEIIDCYSELDKSPFAPSQLMPWVRHLDFLGHTGSKWRNEPGFVDFLGRVSKEGGCVRFLLSTDLSLAAVSSLLRYVESYDCFEVRVASVFPQLRLNIIDEKLIVMQHYEGEQGFDEGTNWDAPLLVVRRSENENAFFHGLRGHFEKTWDAAVPLSVEGSHV